MAGATLGFLKFVLGFDTISFKKGMTEAERDLAKLQKKVQAFGAGMQNIGAKMSLALTGPIAAFAAVGVKEARETEVAIAQVNNALSQTGAVAGQVTPELAKAANAFELASLYEADEVLSGVTANLLRFGKIVPENFQRAQQAAVDFAQVTGKDLGASAVAIGKALSSPTKGLKALQAVGVTFTKEQTKQLQTWIDTGNAAKAQGVILAALETRIKNAALAAQEADPYNKLQDAFKGIAESVGVILIPVLEKIAGAATNIANGFSMLPAPAKSVVVALLAITAAAGPALFALGKITELAAKNPELIKFASGLFKVAEGSRAAAAGAALMNIGLGPLLIALAALALAVTAVVVAWDNWDKIVAWVTEIYETCKTFLFDNLNRIWDAVQTGLGAVVTAFSWLLKAVPFLAGIYNAAKTWVMDKLGAVWNWLKGALETVVGWFSAMVRKVAGWLAPLANLIGGAFKRAFEAAGKAVGDFALPDVKEKVVTSTATAFETGIAEGAAKGAKKAKPKVQKAVDELAPILDRLFPEEATTRKFTEELEKLGAAMDSGRISAERYAVAARRLITELGGDTLKNLRIEIKDPFDPDEPLLPKDEYQTTLEQLEKLNRDKTAEMAEAWGEMASSAVDSMKGMVDAFKSGDILGGIQVLLEAVLNVVKALQGVGIIGGGAATGTAGTYGGARALGGPVVPGKSYMVGENGPEFFSTKRRGFIHPRGSESQTRVQVVPSPYFDVVVDRRAASVAAPMAGQAAIIGISGSEARAYRRSRRNIYAAG